MTSLFLIKFGQQNSIPPVIESEETFCVAEPPDTSPHHTASHPANNATKSYPTRKPKPESPFDVLSPPAFVVVKKPATKPNVVQYAIPMKLINA
jgi:hypothetical protein